MYMTLRCEVQAIIQFQFSVRKFLFSARRRREKGRGIVPGMYACSCYHVHLVVPKARDEILFEGYFICI